MLICNKKSFYKKIYIRKKIEKKSYISLKVDEAPKYCAAA